MPATLSPSLVSKKSGPPLSPSATRAWFALAWTSMAVVRPGGNAFRPGRGSSNCQTLVFAAVDDRAARPWADRGERWMKAERPRQVPYVTRVLPAWTLNRFRTVGLVLVPNTPKPATPDFRSGFR